MNVLLVLIDPKLDESGTVQRMLCQVVLINTRGGCSEDFAPPPLATNREKGVAGKNKTNLSRPRRHGR